MYLSVRVGRRSRIGGGLLFWLFVGPLVLEFLLLSAVVKLAVSLFAQGVHRRPARPR